MKHTTLLIILVYDTQYNIFKHTFQHHIIIVIYWYGIDRFLPKFDSFKKNKYFTRYMLYNDYQYLF